ncbi:TonB C-terminal domain-containing protein [Massilia sp.]|uniref:TonB C-terminal domain-containing protein n=1 Tax=Massilia sp. TaxID=1882437 RepID=UPI00289CCDCB|nr:TonB C-terminal domain-containing protein [Massilia sp.]
MDGTHDFLLALGLDETAGVREVRRAYARRLKQIDQGLDPAGFQGLRDAYETALAWAEYREREAAQESGNTEAMTDVPAPEPVSAAVPAGSPEAPPERTPAPAAALAAVAEAVPEPARGPAMASAPPDRPQEEQLAALVFERLGQGAAELAEQGRLGDPHAWRALLLARLGDAELDNIAARALFEERIVHVLGHGWYPGNEALFPAAVDVFDWAADRRRLALFGYTGNLLNQAIDERALFDTQPPVKRGVQERIAAILRRPEPASVQEVLDYMDELENIELRFPALLAVVADTGKIEHWRTVHAEHAVDDEPAPGTSTRERLARWFVYLVFFFVAFFVLHALYDMAGKPASAPSPPPAAPAPPPIQASAPPPPELLRQHLAPLGYTPTRAGTLSVSYDVFLLDDGTVNATDMIEPSSGDPDYDMAVARAILDAKPFPPDVPRVFRITVSGSSAPAKPQPPAAEPRARARPAAVAPIDAPASAGKAPSTQAPPAQAPELPATVPAAPAEESA